MIVWTTTVPGARLYCVAVPLHNCGEWEPISTESCPREIGSHLERHKGFLEGEPWGAIEGEDGEVELTYLLDGLPQPELLYH